MKKKTTKSVSLSEYIRQALYAAEYERDTSLGTNSCIVGEVPQLSGCYTQAESFEEARENLVEAIELWITVALGNHEQLPEINGCTIFPFEKDNHKQLKKAVA